MSARTEERIAYTLREAAEQCGVSVTYLRAAIKSQGRSGEVPPLRAKFLGGRAGYRIKRADLTAWVDSLPDA